MPTDTRFSCFTLEARGDAIIVNFSVEKVIEDQAIAQLGIGLRQIEDKVTKVVIDCDRVTFFSADALGHLFELHKKLERLGQALRLCCVGDEIYDVLALTRLNRAFKVYDDLSSALASF